MNSLLPKNTTQLERVCERVLSKIVDTPIEIKRAHDAEKTSLNTLEYLAWERSVDLWQRDWSDESKRRVVKESQKYHAAKGTIWSVKQALKNAGYGESEIIESYQYNKDNELPIKWAEYIVKLQQPITIEQSKVILKLLELATPKRCHLAKFDFKQASHLHNNRITHNSQYTHGEII